MSGTFKQTEPLADGDLVYAKYYASDLIQIFGHLFPHKITVRLRDWLIAATGGEGLEGREWWIVPEPDAVATGWTTPESALNFAIGLLGRKPRDDEIIHVRETLPAAPQVGEGKQ